MKIRPPPRTRRNKGVPRPSGNSEGIRMRKGTRVVEVPVLGISVKHLAVSSEKTFEKEREKAPHLLGIH